MASPLSKMPSLPISSSNGGALPFWPLRRNLPTSNAPSLALVSAIPITPHWNLMAIFSTISPPPPVSAHPLPPHPSPWQPPAGCGEGVVVNRGFIVGPRVPTHIIFHQIPEEKRQIDKIDKVRESSGKFGGWFWYFGWWPLTSWCSSSPGNPWDGTSSRPPAIHQHFLRKTPQETIQEGPICEAGQTLKWRKHSESYILECKTSLLKVYP